MIKFSKSLCLNCLHESSEWLYFLQNENIILRAVKNQFGKYKLVLAEESADTGYKIHMRKEPKVYKGLPQDFFVTVEKEEGVEKKISQNRMITPKNRICPYCQRIGGTTNHLPEWMGYQDTLVIGVLGRSSAGKTAYLESCAAPVNLKNSQFGTDDFSMGEMEKLTVTPLGGREDMFKSLNLENKKGKIRIVLLDTPGEMLDDEKSKDIHENDYDWNIQRLNICDAFLYFFDGIYRNGSDEIRWKNRMKKNMDYIAPDTPIAIVTTKLDLLEKECEKNGGILRTREGIPILTKNYFSESRGTTIDVKAKQLLVDKKISRELNDDIAVVVPEKKKAGYFLVSAGSNKEDGEMLYFANSRRLYEPLEFLLLELGAFDD